MANMWFPFMTCQRGSCSEAGNSLKRTALTAFPYRTVGSLTAIACSLISTSEAMNQVDHDVPGTYITAEDGTDLGGIPMHAGQLQLPGYNRESDVTPLLIGQLPDGDYLFRDYGLKKGPLPKPPIATGIFSRHHWSRFQVQETNSATTGSARFLLPVTVRKILGLCRRTANTELPNRAPPVGQGP